MDSEDALLFDKRDGIATFTLNRPEARNALTTAMFLDMERLLLEIAEDTLDEVGSDRDLATEARVLRALAQDASGDVDGALASMRRLGDDMLAVLVVLGLPRVRRLAESALAPVFPSDDLAFPYSCRVCTHVLQYDGSSSMASTCAANMALLATGVPCQRIVGVAIGLFGPERDDPSSAEWTAGSFQLLTDLAAVEDHFGDLDFKVSSPCRLSCTPSALRPAFLVFVAVFSSW